jgi:hypothetical protein
MDRPNKNPPKFSNCFAVQSHLIIEALGDELMESLRLNKRNAAKK